MPADMAFLIMLMLARTVTASTRVPPASAAVRATAPGSVQPVASSISLFRMRTNICLSIWFTVSFLPVRGNLLYSNALDLQRSVLGQLAHLHRAARGVGLRKILAVPCSSLQNR